MSSLSSEFNTLTDTTVIQKAERYSSFTLPYVMSTAVSTGKGTADQLHYDFQSIGALLINNLASKLVRLLFPPAQPFFRLPLTDMLKQELEREGIAEGVVQTELASVEKSSTERLFFKANLAKITRAIKLLIITGQCLLYRDPNTEEIRVWNLQNFVVRRDAMGIWRKIILKQVFLYEDLPPELASGIKEHGKYKEGSEVTVYTCIKRQGDTVTVTYEVDKNSIDLSETYNIRLCPWIVPVWDLADGEQYAKGLVEQFSGDFAKLSVLSQQSTLYSLETLKLLRLVSPQSATSVQDLQDANNGDWVSVKSSDVEGYEAGDYNKIAQSEASIDKVTNRLSTAFMYTSNTRDAERVTAVEIRQKAQEAETSLGGVYSILAETLQAPLAYLCMYSYKPELFPGLVNGSFVPEILTGIPALSRNIDVQNLLTATQEIQITIPVLTQLDQRINTPAALDLFYEAYGVDTERLFKSKEQMQAEANTLEQQAQAQSNLLSEVPELQNAQAALGQNF